MTSSSTLAHQYFAKDLTRSCKTILTEHDRELESRTAATPPLPNLNATDTTFKSLSWMNGFRLLAIRANRFALFFGKKLTPSYFRVFGLSFAVELIVDIIDVARETLSSKNKWDTFKDVFLKDARLYRIVNAIFWLTINAICFYLTDGMSAILNMIGFLLVDIPHEYFWLQRKNTAHNHLIHSINKSIRHLKLLSPNNRDLPHLIKLKQGIENKKKAVLNERQFTLRLAIAVAIGMLCCYAPVLFPALLEIFPSFTLIGTLIKLTNAYPSLPLIGALITLVCSGYSLIGKANKDWSFFQALAQRIKQLFTAEIPASKEMPTVVQKAAKVAIISTETPRALTIQRKTPPDSPPETPYKLPPAKLRDTTQFFPSTSPVTAFYVTKEQLNSTPPPPQTPAKQEASGDSRLTPTQPTLLSNSASRVPNPKKEEVDALKRVPSTNDICKPMPFQPAKKRLLGRYCKIHNIIPTVDCLDLSVSNTDVENRTSVRSPSIGSPSPAPSLFTNRLRSTPIESIEDLVYSLFPHRRPTPINVITESTQQITKNVAFC